MESRSPCSAQPLDFGHNKCSFSYYLVKNPFDSDIPLLRPQFRGLLMDRMKEFNLMEAMFSIKRKFKKNKACLDIFSKDI